MYDWDFSILWQYKRAFLAGIRVTLELTVYSVVLGTVLGYALGVILATKKRWANVLKPLIYTYIAVFGWLPLLVLLVVMYYFLPTLLGIRISAYTVSWIALSLNLSAFVADIVRGAVKEIPSSYTEAAKAVGMGGYMTFRRVIFPEAVRGTLPALVALYINQFKWTTLCSVIGVGELLHTTDTILIRTYRALEAYLAITVIYLILIGLGNLVYYYIQKRQFFQQRA